ncbi:hypothetical protein N2W20_000522 [Clostridium perfringens]|uniref:Uncharacterized protein n=1 Tax=Clostridium perfringens TaxID=1502 RepID=A0A8H9UVU7_CLOPF|nr:hypothetical protein [Clostridium perfringens]EJT5915777.1 hypothetical protein [Clostridium perfringens]EJT6134822.1 hypothetical protein [Clostridium perfringens]MDM0919576.1 hypothetical protein [Clostridium perfringens]HAT4306722.1 hypothetical protein [Clostridium perfringens]
MYSIVKLNELIKLYNFKIEIDNIKILKLTLTIDTTDSSQISLDSIFKIKNYCKDNCKIETSSQFKFIYDKINSSNYDEFENSLKDHFNACKKMKLRDLKYIITIDKSNNLSNINFNWFISSDYLIEILENPISNYTELSSIFKSNTFNYIVILDLDINMKNNFVYISNNDSEVTLFKDKSFVLNNFSMQYENYNTNFDINNIYPDLFYFDSNVLKENKLLISLYKILLFLCLTYIASNAKFDNNILKATVKGKKNINIEFPLESNLDIAANINNIKTIYNIYKFSYNQDNIQNLFITRNIISLFLREECTKPNLELFLQVSKSILDTCKNNLKILSIENSDKYFANRYSVFDFINKSNESIANLVDNLINKMNTFYLSTIASIVASLLLFFKEFNFEVLRISVILYSIYIIYFSFMNFLSSWSMFKSTFNIYNKKLDSFSKILTKEEIDEFSKLLNPKKKFYLYFWINLIITLIILICSYILLFNFDYFKTLITNFFQIKL